MFKSCDYCGAHLDPGEHCDCRDDIKQKEGEQMNAMRELDLEEIKNRLEDIRGELEQIAANERFAIGYSMGDPVSEEQYEEAEQAVCNVADAASRIEEAIEFVQEALK